MSVVTRPTVVQSDWTTDGRPWEQHLTDAREFDAFFVANYDGLVRAVTPIAGSSDAAHDCVQEAFIKAYARWNRLRRLDAPIFWVRKVAINRARDFHRADKRRKRREDRYEAAPKHQPEPGDEVESRIDLVDVLDSLSDRQRTVASLYYIEDISVSEIAKSTGLSEGAVKFHLNRARQALRNKIESRPPND